jgi:hypothetical protein
MTRTTIVARFQIIRWDETSLPGAEGGWAHGAAMGKTFTEGISGTSKGLFITSGKVEGQRAYIATEKITGTLEDGRSGSFVVQHGGLESTPETWFGYIVPGTGTGDLEGITGKAPIHHDETGAYFELAFETGDVR